MMVCAEYPYEERHTQALRCAAERKFIFKNSEGKLRTSATDSFLQGVLAKQNQRMNWEQVLSHQIFKIEQKNIPNLVIFE